MSVSLLIAAVAQHSSPHLAQVSDTLHHDLAVAGELSLRNVSIPVPSDPDYKVVIDDFIRSMGHDPNAPAKFNIYTLRQYPAVAVQIGGLHGLNLLATGPGSFKVS